MYPALSLVALLSSPTGCHDPVAAKEQESDETPSEGVLPADFINPRDGQLTIDSTRLTDLRFSLSDVQTNTVLVVDGVAVGSLQTPSLLGQRVADQLLVRLDGSMVASVHRLALTHPGDLGPVTSTEVEITIVSDRRQFQAEILRETEARGQTLTRHGHGIKSLLWVTQVEDTEIPRIHLLQGDNIGWDSTTIHTLELPELEVPLRDSTSSPWSPDISVDFSDTEPQTIRAAWLTRGSARIDWRAIDRASGETTITAVAMTSSDLGEGKFEWSQLGRPHVQGDNLVAEWRVIGDVENPLPGSHQLVLLGWDHTQTGDAQVFTHNEDLELLDCIIDRTRGELDLHHQLGVRVGKAWPRALELDPATGALSLPDPVNLAAPPMTGNYASIMTVAGAFGSRTVVGLKADGQLSGYMASLYSRDVDRATMEIDELPNVPPSGHAGSGVVDGVPVFVIPYGEEHEVQLIASDGDALYNQTLAGIHCDQLALPSIRDDNDLGLIEFACLREGILQIGILSVVPRPGDEGS